MKIYLVEMWDGNKYEISVNTDTSELYRDLAFKGVNYANFIFEVISCKTIKCRFPTSDYILIAEKLMAFKNAPKITASEFRNIYKHPRII